MPGFDAVPQRLPEARQFGRSDAPMRYGPASEPARTPQWLTGGVRLVTILTHVGGLSDPHLLP